MSKRCGRVSAQQSMASPSPRPLLSTAAPTVPLVQRPKRSASLSAGARQREGEAKRDLPRIYFAGDTDLFPAMADWAGLFDVALLPVWGWGPTLGEGHMDPKHRAAEACRLIQPQLAIPIHWGTLYPMAMHRLSPSFC